MTNKEIQQASREHWLAHAKFHYNSGSDEWTQVSPDFYEEMLGVLPPAMLTRRGFVMPEPYTHDDEGRAVMMILRWRTLGVLAGKSVLRYEMRYGTLAEARDILKA